MTTSSSHPASSKPAVVLLSGGLDSATTLALAKKEGFSCHALSFDYGQRHRIELDAAARIARHLQVASHRWITIDLRAFGHSALTADIPVPKDQLPPHSPPHPPLIPSPPTWSPTCPPAPNSTSAESQIPITYVPARNTIFLAYALALAETLEARDIFLGVNAVDYSGYPDCRPQYIEAFQALANLATKAAVQTPADQQPHLRIHTPLIHWPKTRIIQAGLALGVDYSLTHSCYDPSPQGRPCRHCDSCLLRQQAFADLGMQDPLLNLP